MKSSAGKAWREIAYEWQTLAGLRAAALERVWLLIDTIEDAALAQDLRAAFISDMVIESDDHPE